MASNNNDDLINVMFKSMFKLIFWLIKMVFKTIAWIFKSIYRLITRKANQDDELSDSSYYSPVEDGNKCFNQFYDSIDNYTYSPDHNTELPQIGCDILLHFYISVEQKCILLEKFGKTLEKNSAYNYNMTFILILEHAYETFGRTSMILQQGENKLKKQHQAGEAIDFGECFADLFSFTGAIASQGGNFSLDYNIFNKYNLPTYKIEPVTSEVKTAPVIAV